MWFKNLRAYRLTQPFDLTPEQLDQRLQQRVFTPCNATQPLALGWVPPLGEGTEVLAHGAGGRVLICLKREEKILPASVVRELVDEKVEEIQREQARKVYRKERLSLKDEIVQDCLPRAFTRSAHVYAYIDTRSNWALVDAASAARAEELMNLLRECLGSFPVILPDVNQSPAAVMTGWLLHRDPPEGFDLGEDCELREPGEEGGVVRCSGIDLLGEEVETHLQAGRQVARLALTWGERLSLVIAEDLSLRRLKFADELMKEHDEIPEADHAARLDADFALMSETLSALQTRVMAVFGGVAE